MYTYPQACIVLKVSRPTLNRWLRKAKLRARRDPMDRHRGLLTSAQISRLATMHKRVVQVTLAGADLEERVAELEGYVAQLVQGSQ